MKKICIISIIVFLSFFVIGGYGVLNSIFPIADPVVYPSAEEVTSFSLSDSDGVFISIETADFGEFLQSIGNAKPTRRMSVNDLPAVKPYFTIDIATQPREYRYYIYEENSTVYIESPYEGVYKADRQFLDLIARYFKGL